MAALQLPSAEYLRERLDYDPETGVFLWREMRGDNRFVRSWNTQHSGKVAGKTEKRGYRKITIDNTRYYAHRLAWVYVGRDIPPGVVMDHINGDPLDNRLSNIRVATHEQNCHNSASASIKGVSKVLRKYGAWIRVGGRSKHIGNFSTQEEAHQAYCAAAQEAFGEFWSDGVRKP